MKYWVIKGHRSLNAWSEWMFPQGTRQWHTGRERAVDGFVRGDRVFFWESAPYNRFVGLAEIRDPKLGINADGRWLYRVEAKSSLLEKSPTKAQLLEMAELQDTAFLKQGPADSIFSLHEHQARVIYASLADLNPDLPRRRIWPDLLGG
jgi:predicted RNA-binding protein with PUA-like domain